MKYQRLGTASISPASASAACRGPRRQLTYGEPPAGTSRSRHPPRHRLGITLFEPPNVRTFSNEECGRAIKGKRDGSSRHKFACVEWHHARSLPDGSRENERAPCEKLMKRSGTNDRPLLPASRRRQYADRGDGRRDGRAGEGGQGPPYRPLRSRAGNDPPRRRRAPDRRAAIRIFALGARRRGRDSPRLPRARHRLRALQPARARLPDRPDQEQGRPSAETASQRSALFEGEFGATSRSSTRSARSPTGTASAWRRSRSPGCSRKGPTSSPSRASSAARRSRTAPPRSMWNWARRISKTSKRPAPPRGRATTKREWPGSSYSARFASGPSADP